MSRPYVSAVLRRLEAQEAQQVDEAEQVETQSQHREPDGGLEPGAPMRRTPAELAADFRQSRRAGR